MQLRRLETQHNVSAPASLLARTVHYQRRNLVTVLLVGGVAFREDECPIANATAAANLSAMNRIALSAMNSDSTCKQGIKTKRKRSGWDHMTT